MAAERRRGVPEDGEDPLMNASPLPEDLQEQVLSYIGQEHLSNFSIEVGEGFDKMRDTNIICDYILPVLSSSSDGASSSVAEDTTTVVEKPLLPLWWSPPQGHFVEQSNSSFEDIKKNSPKRKKDPFTPTPVICTYKCPFIKHDLGRVFFYIDGGFRNWDHLVSFKTTVVGPRNIPVAVHLSKENVPTSSRWLGIFLALIPGNYTVSICDGVNNSRVQGSPFTIPVSRNYNMHALWPKPRPFADHNFNTCGIAFSQAYQKVYLTDRDSYQISVYSTNGVLERKFGVHSSKPGVFYRPTGIAVDNLNGRVVVTDKDNHRVCVYTLDGYLIFALGRKGLENGEFNYPWGVAVSPKDGTIAIADSRNDRIQLFDCTGNFLRKYTVGQTNQLEYKIQSDYPRKLTFDLTGENIFVTDFNREAIVKLNVELTEITNFAPKGINLNRPQGIAIDPVGNILVCDCRNNFIRVVSPQGDRVISIPGSTKESFCYPQDLAIMTNGEIAVVDAKLQVYVM